MLSLRPWWKRGFFRTSALWPLMYEPTPSTNRGVRAIAHGLRAKGFSGSAADAAVAAHPQSSFKAALAALVERRRAELPAKRERVIRFLVSRGFAVNDILRALEEAEER